MSFRLGIIVLIGFVIVPSGRLHAQAPDVPVRQPGPHLPSQNNINPLEYDKKNAAGGRRIFYRMCVTCHGMDGKGNTDMVKNLDSQPSDFTIGKFKYGQSDGELFTLIQSGTPNGMTPYGNTLKEHQIWQSIIYIRSLGPEKSTQVTIEEEPVLDNPIEYTNASISRGKQFYARFCIKCHGGNGKGDTEMREFLKTRPSDLTNGDWTFGARDGNIFKVIKEGTDNDMEAFSDRLVDERIWHVVNYLKSLNPKTE